MENDDDWGDVSGVKEEKFWYILKLRSEFTTDKLHRCTCMNMIGKEGENSN